MNTLSLYAIIFLIILLVATSGGFALYQRSAKAEIAILTSQNATYALAVDQQRNTIETLQADAIRLASANRFLTERFAGAEQAFTEDVYRIDALDLSDIEGLQDRVNDEFQRSIDGLRNTTAKKTKPAE